MANTTTNEIPAEVNNFYDRTLLMRVVPRFIHQRWAQVRDIPRKSGTLTIKFRRYGNLSAKTTALNEGVTPTADQLSTTEITATAAQYGSYVTVTDVVNFQSEDQVLMETAEILGDQAGDTLDQLTRDVLVAGTNVIYVNQSARSSITSSDKIGANGATDIRTAVKNLKSRDARRVTQMIEPTTGIDTTPVDRAYIGIVHPDTTFDLKEDVTAFTPVEKYSSQMNVMDGEVGKVDEVRFVETTNAKVFTDAGSGSEDVYATLILGMNAYGVTRVSGETLRNIVKPLGSGNTEDPLEQRATSGWKTTFVAKILNDAFMTRIEHATT